MSAINLQTLSMSFNTVASSGEFNGYLTPDALMTYCQTRLEGIDTQVQKAFAEQQSMNKASAMLGDLANSISLPSGELDLSKSTDFQQALDAAKKLEAGASSAQDPQTKKELQAAADKIYGKLTKYAQEKSNSSCTFDTISASTTAADIDNICGNKDGKHGGSLTDDKDGKISVDEFKADTTDAIHNIQQNISSSAELSMINLQSLMSQRQQAIQLATNLVQSLGDQCNKIADNVGK